MDRFLKHATIVASYNLCLGMDIEMAKEVYLVNKSMFGEARGHKFSKESIVSLRYHILRHNILERLDIFMLDKGWFQLIFTTHEVAIKVASVMYSTESTPIIFKFWALTFDAN